MDGVPLREVNTAPLLGEGTFFFDRAAGMMRLGADPNGRTIEVTRRAYALRFVNGSTDSRLRGIGVRRFGSIQNPSLQPAMVWVNPGPQRIVFERSVSAFAAGGGLALRGTQNACNDATPSTADAFEVTESAFLHNGASKASPAGFRRSRPRD